MLRRAIYIVSLFALLSGIPTTRADDTHAWTAWLHYGRHMTLVNSAGETLREVDLPLPSGTVYPFNIVTNVAVSHSGTLIAYAVEVPPNGQHIMVYDSLKRTLTMDYELPTLYGIYAFNQMNDDAVFNEDDSALALSYEFQHVTGSHDPHDIGIIDLETGSLINAFNYTDFVAQHADFPPAEFVHFPAVQRFKDHKIVFTLTVFTNVYPGSQIESFVWNTLTGSVTNDSTYASTTMDIFQPSGEIIKPVREVNSSTYGLEVYDPVAHAQYPFYYSNNVRDIHFVQNGERVFIKRIDEMENDWILIERDGRLVDQWSRPGNYPVFSVKGVPDGFLYILTTILPDGSSDELTLPALLAVNTRDDKLDAGQTIWHLSFQEYAKRAGGTNVPLEIVWEHDDMPPSAYKPWAQLAPPVYEPTPAAPENLPPPTMIPTPEPLFQVGMTVRVQTIGGEILNLRRDHTRKADVIMYLENKMRLTLLEGPIESEGFTWWRIRTADGVEGWTVANNGDLQTLMPA